MLQHEDYRSVRTDNYIYFYYNDIAILTLSTPIIANGVNIKFAQLPANNDDQFIGQTGIITGWGTTCEYSLPSLLG